MLIESVIKHIIRLGTVTAIYDEEGAVQVTFFDRDDEAQKLSVFSFGYEYDMPNLKDTVLCIFIPFCKDGFVLGKFWSFHDVPSTVTRNVWYKKLRSKGLISFDDTTEILTINVKHIKIIADDVENSGSLTCSKSIHSDADVTADTISLKSHIHGNGNNGADTTAPK